MPVTLTLLEISIWLVKTQDARVRDAGDAATAHCRQQTPAGINQLTGRFERSRAVAAHTYNRCQRVP